VWVVDERYAFRFPRRAVAIPGLERELALLPKLAPLVPLPIPRPVLVGEPTEFYPWPFFGAELIPGVEAGVAELDDDARLEVALELAGFLRSLHALELDEPLPLDPNGRADVHGDLHFRHLLVQGRSASGVIDWGDLCRADPAIDLALYWSFVPRKHREAFLDGYGPVTETQLLRARVLSIQLCAVLAHYGDSEGQPEILRAGLDGLERTLV